MEGMSGSVADSIALAEDLLCAANGGTTARERRQAARLGRLLADPDGRELLFSLTDEVLRAPDSARAMQRLRALQARLVRSPRRSLRIRRPRPRGCE